MSHDPWEDDRLGMVETQLADPIDDRLPVEDPRVLEVMRHLPRHRFVPRPVRSLAYADRPLPLDRDQTVSQPYVVGLMADLAEVTPGTRVLEVGTGSGYSAAVLAALGGEVISVERDPVLAERARAILDALDLPVEVRVADGYAGAPDRAPFDAIVVTAAPPTIPDALVEQLAVGGRMVVPVGPAGGPQHLVVLRRRDARSLDREELMRVAFVPMRPDLAPR